MYPFYGSGIPNQNYFPRNATVNVIVEGKGIRQAFECPVTACFGDLKVGESLNTWWNSRNWKLVQSWDFTDKECSVRSLTCQISLSRNHIPCRTGLIFVGSNGGAVTHSKGIDKTQVSF